MLESTLSQKCQEGILKSNESKSSSRKTSRAEQDATRVQDAAEDTTHWVHWVWLRTLPTCKQLTISRKWTDFAISAEKWSTNAITHFFQERPLQRSIGRATQSWKRRLPGQLSTTKRNCLVSNLGEVFDVRERHARFPTEVHPRSWRASSNQVNQCNDGRWEAQQCVLRNGHSQLL